MRCFGAPLSAHNFWTCRLLASYILDRLQSVPVPRREHHDLRLQSLLCSISGHGLRQCRRLVVGRHPARNGLLRRIASDVAIDSADELVVEMLSQPVVTYDRLYPSRQLFLVEMTCSETCISHRYRSSTTRSCPLLLRHRSYLTRTTALPPCTPPIDPPPQP